MMAGILPHVPSTSLSEPLRRTTVSIATANTITIAAARAGKRVRIHGFFLTATVAGTVHFEDTAGSPASLHGAAMEIPVTTTGGPLAAYMPGMMEGPEDLGVTLTTATATAVRGVVLWSYA